MGTPIDYNHWKSMIPHWMNQTVKLLNPHQIRVLGNPNMFLIHMNDASDGTVRGYEFQPLA